MIDLYKENSRKISENTSINIEIILDLENNPLKETYLKLFLFCHENLKINSPKFEIEPSYFFYYNKENYVNAKATCDNGNYIILISKDLIKRLYENIYSKKTIFSHEGLTKYENLSKLINLNLNDLLFQSSTIFTYYHEFAHLVQKKGGDFSFSENTENIFIPESHILEYDADLNGSQFVCAHIINYYETLSSENQNAENLKNLLSVGLAGILIIFLLLHYRELDDDKRIYEFYLNKYSHPHSMIRISYVIRQYQNTALENGIKIEKTEFFKEAFLISNIFFGSNNYISNCLDILEENFEEIDKNINSLFDESNKRNDLMMQNYMKYNN